MDAVEFLKEYRRMCEEYRSDDDDECSVQCPFYRDCHYKYKNIQSVVDRVEQWSQTHPQKTMMQDFFEKFPNAPKMDNGEPNICPQNLGYGDFCCDDTNHNCLKCWSRPMEE